MKKNLKIYLKHLMNNKLYTFITIFGFALSLMFVLLLGVYIHQELSTDQFHTNKGRLFRLYREKNSGFAPPVGDLIKNHIPEVENYCRTSSREGIISSGQGQKFKINYLLADSSFFSMFSFNLENSRKTNVLTTKNSIVLSRSFARKMFGVSDPIGQEIKMTDGLSFQVTAIMDDFPENTHFRKFDAVTNFTILSDLWSWKEVLSSYSPSCFNIYFLAKPGTYLQTKAPQVLELFKKDYWLYKDNRTKELKFEPLTEVYFSNSVGDDGFRQNGKTLIFVLMAIVLLILSIAIINYVNLSVAQSGLRGKEIAIKKMMGNSKTKLIIQHISESIALCSFATLIAIFLTILVEPYFNTLLNTRLNLASQVNIHTVLLMFLAVPLLGLISGLAPALVMNGYNPVEVVKGTFARKRKGIYSKILIAIQYGIAIILLICCWTINRQTHFMQTYDIGFQKENIFWMQNTIEVNQEKAFRDLLKSIPGTQEVSFVCGSPLDGGNNQSFTYNGKPVSFQEFFVDSAFFKLIGLKITPTDAAYSREGYYLNHAALTELELPETTTTFKRHDKEYPVLGIVNDFNFNSLYKKIGPLMIGQLDENRDAWQILVKISGNDPIKIANSIKNAQAQFTGGIPMESGFVDQTIEQWYKREEKTARLVGAFTLLAIVISAMGIFAMSLFYIQQKVKEIGVRKINGANVSEIMVLLNLDFVKWVVIAYLIAVPIGYYTMHRWLENFAYKTSLSWWIFALAGLSALAIALLTVSWQSWRAATQNPIETLRYE